MPTVSPFNPAVRESFGSSMLAAHGGSGMTSAGCRAFGLPLVPLMLSY